MTGRADIVLEYIQELLLDPERIGRDPPQDNDKIAVPAPLPGSRRQSALPLARNGTANGLETLAGYSLRATAGTVKVLFFDVIGLPLAVPCDRLERLVSDPQLPSAGPAIQYIDLGPIVVPAAWTGLRRRLQRPRHWLVVRCSHWALGCDAIKGYGLVAEAQVLWCASRCDYPYIRGVEKNRNCIVLDVDALLRVASGDGANMA